MDTDDRVRALELALEHNRTLSHVGQAEIEAQSIVDAGRVFLTFLRGDGCGPDGSVRVDGVLVADPAGYPQTGAGKRA